MDPWKRRFQLESIIFSGYVSFREGIDSPWFSHGRLMSLSMITYLHTFRWGNEVAGRPSNIPEMPSKRVAEMPQSLPSPKRSRSDVDVPQEETNESHSCEKCGALDLPSWAARCTACWRLYFRSSDSDFYLRCPIEQKDEAKKRGAAFDFGLKKWYVPAGKDISKCEKWLVRCVKCKEGTLDILDRQVDPSNPSGCVEHWCCILCIHSCFWEEIRRGLTGNCTSTFLPILVGNHPDSKERWPKVQPAEYLFLLRDLHKGLNDHPKMKYDPTSRKHPPQCDPEGEKDRLARVEAEQREQERKDIIVGSQGAGIRELEISCETFGKFPFSTRLIEHWGISRNQLHGELLVIIVRRLCPQNAGERFWEW